MNISRLFLREMRFRVGTFLLGLLAVAAFAACLIGSRAFLAAHDHRTEQLAGGLEERSGERMVALRDEARKFSKNLGFNCMLLPPGQNLADLYADGRSQRFFADADVTVLADARLETLNHLRPVLRERTEWPEQDRDIILVGVRGEVYIKAPRWQKPIEEAIETGQAHLGHALAGLNFDIGPGEQGPEARSPPEAEPRLDHPEVGLTPEKDFRLLFHAGLDDDPGEVLGEIDGINYSDLDILVLDLGFTGLDSLCGPEGDCYLRSLFRDGLDDEPSAHEGGDQGYQPHQRRPCLIFDLGGWGGTVLF